ncbi:hypothetical protein IWQ49_006447 [Labrenzia sp. EL_126]|nr:hypothetical protein [Labrenzia sp. EL_126]
MRGNWIKYSADELEWLEANKELPRRILHDYFVRIFKRTDVSYDNIKSLCTRRKWNTGRDGRFGAGHVPANKGQKMPYNANSARTQFKKGHRGGEAEKKYKPIGTERVTRDGYVERKIHDGMPLQSRWKAVQRIRWEELNGPLSEGMALKCLDGDKANTDPSNWVAVPRAMLPRLNGIHGRDYDSAPAELKPVIMTLTRLEHEARERKREAHS